jgi:hypothetical protein
MRSFGVRRVTTLAVVTCLLLGLLAVPASAAAGVSILSRVESLGAAPVSEEDCAAIEGEGLLLGLAGGLAGAAAAGLARVVGYVVDQVSDWLFGEDDEGDEWSTRDLYESMASGFIGGLIGGLFAPSG